MKILFIFGILFICSLCADNEGETGDTSDCYPPDHTDNGTQVIITPYIFE